MTQQAYMRVENIVKQFGPFMALNGVNLDVYPGEVHALLGDNGAGKSTLIKILSGVHQPTSGTIYIDGKARTFRNPRDAASAGVGTVYQDLAINQLMSVTRNFFMGRELKSKFGILRMDEMNQIAHDEMLKIGIDFSDPSGWHDVRGTTSDLGHCARDLFRGKGFDFGRTDIGVGSKTTDGSFENHQTCACPR